MPHAPDTSISSTALHTPGLAVAKFGRNADEPKVTAALNAVTRSAVTATPDDWFDFKILKRDRGTGDPNLAADDREKYLQLVSGVYLIFQTETQYPRHPAHQLGCGESHFELNIPLPLNPCKSFTSPVRRASGAAKGPSLRMKPLLEVVDLCVTCTG